MTPDEVTPDQIAQLREFIDEPDNAEPYTDDALKSKIAAADGIVGAVAYYIWVSKAASLSSLVDISEGGSSRKNSQTYTAAKGMMDHFLPYVPKDPGNVQSLRVSRTRAIVRP